MTLSTELSAIIEATIRTQLENKLRTYKPETKYMPFHFRLLGKDRMALFSFIHSLNTTFGKSIFGPVAESIAKYQHVSAQSQYVTGKEISQEAQSEIQSIMNDLSNGENPDKLQEIERIRAVCRKGKTHLLKTVKVDLVVKDHGLVHFFDIKTVKPNVSNFKDFKRTLLEWTAIYLKQNPNANIHTYIAIPYNPYEPKPYERWTMKGMLDIRHELKVADEFWDFLGGPGTYHDLLGCFQRVGLSLRDEIERYFSKFK